MTTATTAACVLAGAPLAGASAAIGAIETLRHVSKLLHVLNGGNAAAADAADVAALLLLRLLMRLLLALALVVAPLALQRVDHFVSQGARLAGEDDGATQSSPISCILYLSFHPRHVMVLVGVELVGQILHDVAEDDGIDVVAQHVQQEPVAHFRAAHDHLDGVAFH